MKHDKWSFHFSMVCIILPFHPFYRMLDFAYQELSSRLDSVSDVSRSGMTMLESISPMCCILDCCDLPSVSPCKACNSRLSWRTEANVSMIARVACVACGLFRIVARHIQSFLRERFGEDTGLG